VEDEFRQGGGAAALDDAVVKAVLFPAGEAFGFARDEVSPHREGRVGEVQGRFVAGGAVGFAHKGPEMKGGKPSTPGGTGQRGSGGLCGRVRAKSFCPISPEAETQSN